MQIAHTKILSKILTKILFSLEHYANAYYLNIFFWFNKKVLFLINGLK